MSKVIVHRRAANYLKRLPRNRKNRVKKTLERVGKNPLGFADVRRMSGKWAGYHRIRLGDIRMIYWFGEEDDIVYVDHIGPRGDIYK
ncbi:MAG: type II toxin-antitoxin system RelE/ParE family toxin [Deltaproteobacteria bacterium]|jgi:mRNA interferase RelE/StbE|nr:type II toxin-antitoxin system RelE/ParE family toxin [Deltaproteobacteria bacterium]MDL1976824.1 type II toxin-antitoxin system RelE/ParE family toxin [Deltaproteobacteria bacterium]